MNSKKRLLKISAFNGCKTLLTAASIILIYSINTFAGVLVAPTSIIMSDTKRTGRLTIQNPTDKPKEVSINFSYGIPESDSLGNISVELKDSAITNPKSAVEWVRAFPRRMVLEPNASQVVRFVAKPPKDLPDGEYWARVVVTSQEGATNLPTAGDDEKITTHLNMIMQTALVLKYRTGNLISKLEVAGTKHIITDSTTTLFVDMVNRGNVSYVGIVNYRLLDNRNREIFQDAMEFAVYTELRRKLTIPIPEGNYEKPYKVEISISNEGRTDIPPDLMVYGNSIEFTTVID